MPSPPPAHNFDEIPRVEHLDDFWHRKYGHGETGEPVRVAAGGQAEHAESAGEAAHPIHMPNPSYFPLVAAAGLPLIAYGLMYQWALSAVGLLLTLGGLYGWALEPSEE